MATFSKWNQKSLLALSVMAGIYGLPSTAMAEEEKSKKEDIENIIVTGVFKSSSQDGSAVAISSIGEDELNRTTPHM